MESGLLNRDYETQRGAGDISPWLLSQPTVDLNILQKKGKRIDVENKGFLGQEYIREQSYAYVEIYTDGSKDATSVDGGVGIYIYRTLKSFSQKD